jgi:hypothetical protein
MNCSTIKIVMPVFISLRFRLQATGYKTMTDVLKPLGTSEGSFLTIIQQGMVYVDKSKLILELLKHRGPYFLSRPRRFGKSLLVDTIQQIFEGKKELFSGLEIESLVPDFNWAPLPVIRINMNGTDSNPDIFGASLLNLLELSAESLDVKINPASFVTAITSLVSRLSNRHRESKRPVDNLAKVGNGNVVLLVDEYDFPLLKNLDDPTNVEKMRRMLYDFYSAIKSCVDSLRFLFITGITKFRQLSLFSALNNVKDITFDDRFSSLCGFEKHEIKSYYGDYLDQALSVQIKNGELPPDSNVAVLLDRIADWYDGYSWDGKKRIFNPFAIKNFLECGESDDYWYNSGIQLLDEMLESVSGSFFSIFGKKLSAETATGLNDTQNIHNEAFLLQAGYLTIDNVTGSGKTRTYNLKIPNKEIRDAIDFELKQKFRQFLYRLKYGNKSSGPHELITDIIGLLLSSLWSRKSKESEMYLSSIFSGISRDLYRGGGENYYNIILLILFRFGGAIFDGDIFKVISQLFSDAGRSDLVFEVPGGGYVVIELKFAPGNPLLEYPPVLPNTAGTKPSGGGSDHSGHSDRQSEPACVTELIELGKISERLKLHLEGKAEEAFEQIRTKHYAKQLFISRKPVLAVAVVVYGTSTVLVRFKAVEWLADNQAEPEAEIIRLSVPKDAVPQG